MDALHRSGPLLDPHFFQDTKDPCPVFDGTQWHIYGSGGSSGSEQWKIFHATAPALEGPWKECEPAMLNGIDGPHVAAPGVIVDPATGLFHMFVQSDFMALGTTIEHLVSSDGHSFERKGTALESVPLTVEAGIYDPHPSVIGGQKYLVYSAMTQVSRPDLFLAVSESGHWEGPWKRLGRILAHEDVPHHNQHEHQDYEWGLEGAQLLQLADDVLLLIAVCFLPEGSRGTRQRVFFAASPSLTGPYYTLGPVLEPRQEEPWESGENGHAAAVMDGEHMHLFYQARSSAVGNARWRYGYAVFALSALTEHARTVILSGRDRMV